MKHIKGFKLEVEPSQQIEMPFNSEILGLNVVGGKPYLYVLIDTSYKVIVRTFLIIGEEKELSNTINRTKYIGSFLYKDIENEKGEIALNVFEG